MKWTAFASGLLFGVGLAVSGMTQPSKILDFLDVTGPRFDPSLALVMAAAIAVHFAAQRIARRWKKPLVAPAFPTYPPPALDARLLVGSALFGAGWGIGGFCPGPAIISAEVGTRAGLIFLPAMVAGMALFRGVEILRARPRSDETGQAPESCG